jgi:Ran GTPase-activating protein 1
MPTAEHFELDANVREALTAERAEELLAALVAGVTSVKLGGKSFGDGSAEVAASAMARVAPTLRHLDIADVIASRPEDEAKRALAAIAGGLTDAKGLVSLDLSDNAFGLKGIREVQSILSGQGALESLKLCNNGLAADAGEIIAAALTERTPTKLKLLHFHNNLLESAGAKALAPIVEASPALEDFRFSALRLHHDGASRICDALACVPENLRRVNVSDNNFGAAGAASLAAALRSMRRIEELVLRDTALCDGGVAAVCGALVEGAGRRLQVLDLSGNEMTADGARALRKCLQGCPVLRVLMVEDNELGSAGARQIARALHPVIHADLATIVAASSEVGTSGALALARAAVQLPGLASINLNGNTISADALEDIQALLSDKLDSLSENDADEDEEEGDDGGGGDDSSADESREASGTADGGDVDKLASAVGSLSVGQP